MDRLLGWIIGTVFGTIIGLTIAGWRFVGWRVFWWLAPRTATIDPIMERWATARTVLGVILVITATLIWDPDPERLARHLTDAQLKVIVLPAQVAAAVVIAAAVLIVIARRGERRRMARNVLRPVGVVGTVLGVLVGVMLLMWGSASLMQASATFDPGWRTTVMITTVLVSTGVSFAGSAACWYGFRSISKHCFRARDGHPAMSAFVMIVLSAWTLTIGISEVTASGWDSRLPLWVAVSMLVVGPTVVIALSVIELCRLVKLFAIPLRRAI